MAVNNSVHGIEDLKAKLLAITPALRKRVLRNALSAGARVVRGTQASSCTDTAGSRRDSQTGLKLEVKYSS